MEERCEIGGCTYPDTSCSFFAEREALQAENDELHRAMRNAVPLINMVGDSTLKRLWREAGYDTPRRRVRS